MQRRFCAQTGVLPLFWLNGRCILLARQSSRIIAGHDSRRNAQRLVTWITRPLTVNTTHRDTGVPPPGRLVMPIYKLGTCPKPAPRPAASCAHDPSYPPAAEDPFPRQHHFYRPSSANQIPAPLSRTIWRNISSRSPRCVVTRWLAALAFLRYLLKGRQMVVVSSHSLLTELCDDKRFPKLVSGAVKEISALVHDGLFTYVAFALIDLTIRLDIHLGPTRETKIGGSLVCLSFCLYLNDR